ncbi:MAG: sterol-binding protein [Actinobacteria bacterium 13_1_20CM_3_68_9]|nr:MAG: sterol-binding protein [Actinobacteria bacterium 13_1_20CM_3_68_9]
MSVAQKDGIDQRSFADQISYDDLYRRWEQGNWKATEIDFAEDREGWRSLSEMQRRSALWTYSMFFYGEDSVTDNLSPYIDAAPLEEQKYFLATQQVDEARHAVFFHRFFKEVIGAGESIGSTLASTEAQLGWGYRNVFDRLDRMADELRKDRSLPKFAQAIALYHMIVEAALAQPGQHFIEDYFNEAGTMPGFSAGMHNVSRDEQRHIGFGVKTLADCFRQSEECKAAVVEVLREVLPWSMSVFVPPDWDLEYTRCYGFELEDIYAFGMRSVETKWKAAGFPIEAMPPDVFPFDTSKPHVERAKRAIALMRAGVIGEPVERPDSSPDTQALLFDVIARSANSDAVNGSPVTIQWRFTDAAPWYVRIDNGSSEAIQGEAPQPSLTLETSWRDWLAVSTYGGDPRRAMLRRKLRPHGSLRTLWRMQRIFPG